MKTPAQQLIEIVEYDIKQGITEWRTTYLLDELRQAQLREKEVVNQAYKQGNVDRKSSKFIIDYYESLTLNKN